MRDGEGEGGEGSASDLAQMACEIRADSMRSNSSGSGRESSERQRARAATAKILGEHRRTVQQSAKKSVVTQQLVKLSPMEPDDKFDHVLNTLGVPMRIERCKRPALPPPASRHRSAPLSTPTSRAPGVRATQVPIPTQQGSPRFRLQRGDGGTAAAPVPNRD